MHGVNRRIPGGGIDDCFHLPGLLLALLFAEGKRPGTTPHKRVAILRHENNIAIGFFDIGNFRTDDGQRRRHIFQNFGGADKTRRGIQGKRHQANIPSGQKLRQRLIGLLAKIVNIGALRQAGGIDFHHRPDHHNLPVGVGVRHRGNKIGINALIYHPVVAETGMRHVGL